MIVIMNEFNVLLGNFEDGDKDLFFGPLTESDVWVTPDHNSLPQLLKELGFFESNSQARKAGWDGQIPRGFSDFVIGKKKIRLTILNIIS